MKKISVILNVYKRNNTLEKQISAIKSQSIGYENIDIHVWYNHSGNDFTLPNDKDIKTYQCNWNTKFWGRFTVPLMCNTEYIAMFDDDILPNENWLKNCIESMNKQEGLYGGSGVVLNKKSYVDNYKIGWNGEHSNEIKRVDLVGHAWFFKQEWIKYMWMEKPYTWDNGEDIMFSYLLQKYGKINTFVPPHPENDKTVWSSDYNFAHINGNDFNATYLTRNDHYKLRNEVVIHCINNGWGVVKKIK